MVVTHNKSAIIVDFFVRSATTGYAVLELNKEDDGNL
jgi:adenine specific DNA methylase Mod